VGFESRLGAVIYDDEFNAVIYGIELGVVIYGIELSARSSATSNRATKLDAVSHGVEMCNLDALNHGIDPQSLKLSLRHLGV
jgi:hypothetical protein